MVLILAFFGALLVSHFVVDTTFDALGWKGFEVTCSQTLQTWSIAVPQETSLSCS
jgi:hypothetical protein